MSEEIVYVKCANTICDKTIPFVKGAYALPEKTYCDYCCNQMVSRPNNDDGSKMGIRKKDFEKSRRAYPVFCIDCGYSWFTECEDPVCPNCKSGQICEDDRNDWVEDEDE